MPTWFQGFEVLLQGHRDATDQDIRDLRHHLDRKLELIMAGLQDVLDQIGTWGESWRDRAIAAEAAAVAANAAAASAKAASDAVIANDAADDLVQLQAQADADAALAQTKLDELNALDAPAPEPPVVEPTPEPEPVPPVEETPAEPEPAPVEDVPVVDAPVPPAE